MRPAGRIAPAGQPVRMIPQTPQPRQDSMTLAPQQAAPPRLSHEAIVSLTLDLSRKFGNRVVTSNAVREQHANTLTWTANQPPDIVVYPENTEEVVEIVKLCAARRAPIIPFGTGTSFEGHTN